jgi:hypothetical protein
MGPHKLRCFGSLSISHHVGSPEACMMIPTFQSVAICAASYQGILSESTNTTSLDESDGQVMQYDSGLLGSGIVELSRKRNVGLKDLTQGL